jgi:hypothetical protein
MARISQNRVRGFLNRSQNANTTKAKGQIFEDLVCYLFEQVPGITISQRNILNPYQSEEVDICFWNEKANNGFHFLPNAFLVEAKNWSTPAGSPEIAHFTAKLEERDLDHGFFIALQGISGTQQEINAARDKVRLALIKGIRILVMKGTDIQSFTSGADLVIFAKQQICQLAASGRRIG